MPELLHPGVYVVEIPSGVRPIEGVSTSTAAFIGMTDKGPLPGTKLPSGRAAGPVMVTSFTDYLRQFGGYRADSFLTYAVKAFFDNGGRRLYIVRAGHKEPPASGGDPAQEVPARSNALYTPSITFYAAAPGRWAALFTVAVTDATNSNPDAFDVSVNVLGQSGLVEVGRFPNLTPATVRAAINASKFIRLPADPTARPVSNLGLVPAEGVDDGASQAWVPMTGAMKVLAVHSGSWANALLTVDVEDATNKQATDFNLVVKVNGTEVEKFKDLTLATAQAAINAGANLSKFIRLPADPAARPANAANQAMAGGTDGTDGTAKAASVTAAGGMEVVAAYPGSWANALLTVDVEDAKNGQATDFNLVVKVDGKEVEKFEDLTLATAQSAINASRFIRLSADLAARPANAANQAMAGGADGTDGTTTQASVSVTTVAVMTVVAAYPGSWANALLTVDVEDATNGRATDFNLVVRVNGTEVERFYNLAPATAQAAINSSRFIQLSADPNARPATAANQAMAGGADGTDGTAKAATFGPGLVVPVTAATEGKWGDTISVQISDSSDRDSSHFKLSVLYGPTLVETFDDLAVKPVGVTSDPVDYAVTMVNSRSEFIGIGIKEDGTLGDISYRPANTTVVLSGGGDGIPPVSADLVGQEAPDSTFTGTGLHALDKITDVNLIAIPGQGDPATINAGMAYCKNQRQLQDCFFIGDVGYLAPVNARNEGGQPDVQRVGDARDFATVGFNGGVALDKAAGDYGAIYYPWVWSGDPIGIGRNPRILLPPSGFMTGVYARTDNSRGVFKAPAGTEAGVAGALAPATIVSDAEQDLLNPIKVNVVRTVPGSGLVVWGTRTIGSDPEWRYIPVRRMAIFLRTSIYYGIQWAVFEPNDEPLWSSLRLNIRAFMLTQFRAGAFQGAKPDEAFFVKCDSSTTTQTDIDNGVVNILVGFAPLKPAEFVVLRLQQKVNQPAA
jgi:phage tail sheath protein FI